MNVISRFVCGNVCTVFKNHSLKNRLFINTRTVCARVCLLLHRMISQSNTLGLVAGASGALDIHDPHTVLSLLGSDDAELISHSTTSSTHQGGTSQRNTNRLLSIAQTSVAGLHHQADTHIEARD